MLVRELGYTWEQVLDELAPRTFFTLDQLETEAEKRRERKEEMEEDQKSVERRMN